jgi:hypothetical protein
MLDPALGRVILFSLPSALQLLSGKDPGNLLECLPLVGWWKEV